jgi:hypothetical protein
MTLSLTSDFLRYRGLKRTIYAAHRLLERVRAEQNILGHFSLEGWQLILLIKVANDTAMLPIVRDSLLQTSVVEPREQGAHASNCIR